MRSGSATAVEAVGEQRLVLGPQRARGGAVRRLGAQRRAAPRPQREHHEVVVDQGPPGPRRCRRLGQRRASASTPGAPVARAHRAGEERGGPSRSHSRVRGGLRDVAQAVQRASRRGSPRPLDPTGRAVVERRRASPAARARTAAVGPGTNAAPAPRRRERRGGGLGRARAQDRVAWASTPAGVAAADAPRRDPQRPWQPWRRPPGCSMPLSSNSRPSLRRGQRRAEPSPPLASRRDRHIDEATHASSPAGAGRCAAVIAAGAAPPAVPSTRTTPPTARRATGRRRDAARGHRGLRRAERRARATGARRPRARARAAAPRPDSTGEPASGHRRARAPARPRRARRGRRDQSSAPGAADASVRDSRIQQRTRRGQPAPSTAGPRR